MKTISILLPLNNDTHGEVTQRLTSAKESSSKPALQSHEDLAKKLQEELERNQKASGSKSDGCARQVKEVACPICTV
ncbi:hypothetical protein JHK82_022365 [Glycine max]|uniref:Uncharacterized protein n=2 Tax=Glycine subgen. Soja TaxID=1462606 RepID=A0A0R0J1P7_SOYBN|nr:hypothetical protein JHK87_022280 [Glycine soja]KAG5016712.1 hypothetical protein JHK85_022848 [Glycine max]KAG5026469.1 hypothetical protein JHK86_022383 [Glycine max]KAG5137634.1 hypothetical protein JHK82_022365 [Glycine max]KAH1052964.1 hypothetical protein GYH30_022311 [Glycine max]